MPQVWQTEKTEEREQYLKNLFENVYLSDIINRYHLRGVEEIGILTDVLASSVGSLTNTLKIKNTFRSERQSTISLNTINSYIGYLKDAFLLSEARRYDVKGRQYISAQQKYYFADLGLRNARLDFRQQDDGHLMENMIYLELVRRGYSVDVGVVELTRVKDGKKQQSQYEIDFVVNTGQEKIYIQSALNVDSEEKKNQETFSLKNSGDLFRKIVIVDGNTKQWTDEDGIVYIGVIPFLLEESRLGF
jgi:predicted AAA+ superfamily ATPase